MSFQDHEQHNAGRTKQRGGPQCGRRLYMSALHYAILKLEPKRTDKIY